jgi:hypothetical protein
MIQKLKWDSTEFGNGTCCVDDMKSHEYEDIAIG